MVAAASGFKEKSQRIVPQWILEGNQEVRCAFTRGFFDADGYYHIRPEEADYRVRFGQSDPVVLEGIRDILCREGFKCSKVLGPYKSKQEAKPYYELHLHGRMQMQRFHRKIRPCHPDKACI